MRLKYIAGFLKMSMISKFSDASQNVLYGSGFRTLSFKKDRTVSLASI